MADHIPGLAGNHFLARVSKSNLQVGNWTVLALIKVATLDP